MNKAKYIYIMLFFLVVSLGSIFLSKESAYAQDCDAYDTQCIVCQAQVEGIIPNTNYTLNVTVLADGNGGATIVGENSSNEISFENNLVGQNFVSVGNQTLTCPIVYYKHTPVNGGREYKITLQTEKTKDSKTVQFNQFEKNNKPFKTSTENASISCQFQGEDLYGNAVAKVTITTDGKTITNMTATNGYVVSNLITDVSKFINNEGELYCPSDAFFVACGASGGNKGCSIQDAKKESTEAEEVKDADDLKNEILGPDEVDCDIDGLDSLINKAVNDSKITSDINEKIVNLQRLINKESFDPSDYTDKNKIESYCNGPLNAIEDLIKNIDSYNLNANEIENIRASVKNNYSNCKFSLSDEQVNEKIINSFDKKIQELKQKAINLNDDAKEKAQKCVEAANAIDDSDKDDILDNLNQKNDQINDLIDNSFEKFKNKISSIALGDPYDGLDCEGLLGDKLLSTIDKIFGYVKIAAPIILIVLGSVDFGQAVLLDDKDALKKAGSKFIKRAIVCIAIFFVPTILSYILHYVDGTGVDPMCGIK